MDNGKFHIDLVYLKVHSVNILTGYKSPSTPTNIFYNYLQNILRDKEKEQIVLIGDFNFNIFNENSNFENGCLTLNLTEEYLTKCRQPILIHKLIVFLLEI